MAALLALRGTEVASLCHLAMSLLQENQLRLAEPAVRWTAQPRSPPGWVNHPAVSTAELILDSNAASRFSPE